MDLWRISNHQSLTGESGLRYAARWNTAGRRIVYLAESPAGAMLEVLVHLELEQDELPRGYLLLRVSVPDVIAIKQMVPPQGEVWKTDLSLTRRLGDRWLLGQKTALARVSSAILRDTYNYLLNPLHQDAHKIKLVEASPADFDPRLFRHLRG